jgi:hypothetical protein
MSIIFINNNLYFLNYFLKYINYIWINKNTHKNRFIRFKYLGTPNVPSFNQFRRPINVVLSF